ASHTTSWPVPRSSDPQQTRGQLDHQSRTTKQIRRNGFASCARISPEASRSEGYNRTFGVVRTKKERRRHRSPPLLRPVLARNFLIGGQNVRCSAICRKRGLPIVC